MDAVTNDERHDMQCIDLQNSKCEGEVFNRLSVTGASRSPRCEGHYVAYRARVEPQVRAVEARYPRDAPSWFDPSYAGESWDEDY